MFKEVANKMGSLYTFVSKENFTQQGDEDMRAKRKRLHDTIKHPQYLPNLELAIKILQPIDIFLLQCQSNSFFLSDVYHHWNLLPSYYDKLNLSPQILQYIKTKINYRKNFILNESYQLCYHLDPRRKKYLHCQIN